MAHSNINSLDRQETPMNATESTMDNTNVSTEATATEATAAAPAVKHLSPEEKAKREEARKANEALYETVRAEAEAAVMIQYGFPGVPMSEMLRAQSSTQVAIRNAAKAILKGSKPSSVRAVGGSKKTKDAQRVREQLIKSLEFADHNGLLKREGDNHSVFSCILMEIFECELKVDTFDSFVPRPKEEAEAAEGSAEVAAE